MAAAEPQRKRAGETAPATPTPTSASKAPPEQEAAAPVAGKAGAPAPALQGQGQFQWSLASLKITDSTVHVLNPHGPLDLGVGVQLSDLAGAGDRSGHVKVDLALQQGALHVDGDVRVAPPGFGGEITLDSLALPPIVVLRGLLPAQALQSATLGGALTIEAGCPPRASRRRPLERCGWPASSVLPISKLAPPGMKDLEVGADSIDVELSEVAVPGAMPGGESAAIGPVRLAGEIQLSKPRVVLADGKQFSVSAEVDRRVDLASVASRRRGRRPLAGRARKGAPGLTGGPPDAQRAGSCPAGSDRRGGKAASPAATGVGRRRPLAGEAGNAAPPGIEVKVGSLQVERGKLDITDDAVKPAFSTPFPD